LLDADALDPFQQLTTDEIPLKELQEKWLASEWSSRIPVAVEVPFETVLAGALLRGRIDAVYRENDQYRIVDWKTGRKKGGDDLEVAAIQLAMYRLAYSKLHQIELSQIGACFYYVGSNETVAPADFLAEKELIAIITAIPQS
jgi:DNA helicase-2/ATP-dependent DNA helicase PcrA